MQCITGADPGIFDWVGGGGGVQTLFQKRLLNFFVVNYFSPITPTPPHPHTPTPPHPLLPNAVANKFPWPVKK